METNKKSEEFNYCIEFECWEDFENNVINNISSYISSYIRDKTNISISFVDSTIFRGLGESTWENTTTLDRAISEDEIITTIQYYDMIQKISKVVNTCFDLNWEIRNLDKLEKPDCINDEKLWQKKEKKPYWLHEKTLEFMTYLRHYGFPSPLLDWTYSPYIATYFAYNSNENDKGNVAVISYTQINKDEESDVFITSLGPYIKSHKRHYLQKSQYTICTKSNEKETIFEPYKTITIQENPKEDFLIKFEFPAKQKHSVLAKLDSKMNINEYSLFGTQEALMNTLTNREFRSLIYSQIE